ncbi:MAG: hypothetical protein IKX22_05180 [Prevotella sp.]|nr:hypothetical protein [Prevotella sp.]
MEEYITVKNITLLVSVLTLLVAIATYCVTQKTYRYTKKRDKLQREELIRRKEAQLKAMEDTSRFGMSHTDAGSIRVNISALRAEIEQLKESL